METTDLSVIKNRIDLIRKRFGMNLAEFAEAISVGRATITHIAQGRNNPSLEVIMKIINRFPDISIEWLLNGNGEMERSISTSDASADLFSSPENGVFQEEGQGERENAKEKALTPADISTHTTVKEVIRYVEKPAKKIVEVRIFFDDNTFEVFKPEI